LIGNFLFQASAFDSQSQRLVLRMFIGVLNDKNAD